MATRKRTSKSKKPTELETQESVEKILSAEPENKPKPELTLEEDLLQTDAKIRPPKEYLEMEKLLAIDKVNPFGTLSLVIFKDNIAQMSKHELYQLSNRVGSRWYANRALSEKSLVIAFQSHQGSTHTSIAGPKQESYDKETAQSIEKILNDDN